MKVAESTTISFFALKQNPDRRVGALVAESDDLPPHLDHFDAVPVDQTNHLGTSQKIHLWLNQSSKAFCCIIPLFAGA